MNQLDETDLFFKIFTYEKIVATLFLLFATVVSAQTDNFVVNTFNPPIIAPNPDYTTQTNIDADMDGNPDYSFQPVLVRYWFYTYFNGLNNSDGDSCFFSYVALEDFNTFNTSEVKEWYTSFRNDCTSEP